MNVFYHKIWFNCTWISPDTINNNIESFKLIETHFFRVIQWILNDKLQDQVKSELCAAKTELRKPNWLMYQVRGTIVWLIQI